MITPTPEPTSLVARLLMQVEQIMRESGDPEHARGFDAARWLQAWLDSPVPAHGGPRPAEYLHTPESIDLVSRLLASMPSGAYWQAARQRRGGARTPLIALVQPGMHLQTTTRLLYLLRSDLGTAGTGPKLTGIARVWLSGQDEATVDAFVQGVRQFPQVVECYVMAGDTDLLLWVRAPDLEGYRRFHMVQLGRLVQGAEPQN